MDESTMARYLCLFGRNTGGMKAQDFFSEQTAKDAFNVELKTLKTELKIV